MIARLDLEAARWSLPALLFLGCGAESVATPAGGEPEREALVRNVILVSLDTLRADRLGVYGHASETSPALDRFAARSVVFRNAIAESSWTIPSHMSMFTGLYPSNHGVESKYTRLRPRLQTVASRLSDQGIVTFADADGGFFSQPELFTRGFDVFKSERRGTAGVLSAFEHCPYAQPEPYTSLFRTPDSEPAEIEGKCRFDEALLTSAQVRFISECYDGDIRFADEHLGGFLERLEAAGHLEDTAVVITSDHGEAFREHGRIGHGGTLYRELLHIPLIVYVPGATPRVVDELVGLVDLPPTILELLGVEWTKGKVDGRSLVPCITGRGELEPVGFRYSELSQKTRLRSFLSSTEHLILDPDTGEVELYDLVEDPTETTNLAQSQPARAAALRAQLEEFMATHAGRSEGRVHSERPGPRARGRAALTRLRGGRRRGVTRGASADS